MKTTGNLGLKKPDGTDIVDITDLNGNMDILDTAVKAVQDHAADTVKHITAAERTAWNGKASTATATNSVAGLMAAADKSKLDSVAQGANNYVHPSTHSPSIITQDASNRFVTDAEKTAWNGKANLVTTPQQTTAAVTYFVRIDGSDSNSGIANTAAGAFKTVQKAINSIPQIVNHTVIVNVAAGTYAEEVVITGFSGRGVIQLNGDSMLSTSRTVQYVGVIDCLCRVEVIGLNTSKTTGAGFSIAGSSNILLYRCVVISSATTYGFFIECSKVYINECQVSNRLWGIYAHVNAEVLVQSLYGTGCTNGLSAAYGGVIAIQSSTLTATSMYSTSYGGTIHVEGNGVINPWGDNTTASRSFSRATAGGSNQILTANTWTKAQYPSENLDHLNEYDTSMSRFVAKQRGVYQINASAVLLTGGSVGEMNLYANGSMYRRMEYCFIPSGFSYALKGSACIELSAGDYLEIYVRSSTENSLSTGWDGCFEITRVS
ncbi:hypothetical protein NST04_07735 [Paenibacillus sp. FSL H7-0756]|uniref:hypothetical protein n=1 Tax=Paenibacillus sp. FSL H7-0756 TaxID=2954738 RepID=UPI0030F7DC69